MELNIFSEPIRKKSNRGYVYRNRTEPCKSRTVPVLFQKHIPDSYPPELRLNKTNTLTIETPFLDLNINNNNNMSIYDKRD